MPWSAPAPEPIRYLVWGAAFLAAGWAYGSHTRGRDRFALALLLGAVFAHLGWAIVHLPRVMEFPGWVLQPGAASVLFVPLGILLVAPWREALAALPLALAIARLGCLPYECCYEVAWAGLPEVTSLVALHIAARRWPQHTTAIVLSGFGVIRLLSLPLRSASVAEPFVDPAWVAVAWIVAGVLLRRRIGTAETAREWFPERTEPLLRSLALMLVVWLLFPLGGNLFEDPSNGLIVASLAALALLLTLRRPLRPSLTLTSAATFGAALLFGVSAAAITSLGPGFGEPTDAHLPFAEGPATTFALVAIAPVFEELLYRDRLLGVLRTLWGGPLALVASSALFALGHMDPQVMPVAFAGGLVCGAVMLRTGSLAAVIGLHAGWNLGVVSPR